MANFSEAAKADSISVSIITPPSNAPVLVSPANSTADIDNNAPLLQWNPATGASSYEVQIAYDSGFTSMVVDATGITGTSYQSNLSYGNTYYWRVQGNNGAGWSATWAFSTGTAYPSAPSLVSPSNGASGRPTSLTLQWQLGSWDTSYNIQVATDSNFTSLVVNQTGLSQSTSSYAINLSAQGTYYWRVAGVNRRGIAWSSAWSFNTITITTTTQSEARQSDTISVHVLSNVVYKALAESTKSDSVNALPILQAAVTEPAKLDSVTIANILYVSPSESAVGDSVTVTLVDIPTATVSESAVGDSVSVTTQPTGTLGEPAVPDSVSVTIISLQVVSALPATGVAQTSATLNGQLIEATYPIIEYGFLLGKDQVTFVKYPANDLQGGNFSVALSSLTPNTLYYFKAYGLTSAAETDSSILNFVTKPSIPVGPTIPTGIRTSWIVRQIMKWIGDLGQKSNIRQEILHALDQVQMEICQRGLALPSIMTTGITTIAGTDTYALDAGIYRVKDFVPPSTWPPYKHIHVVNDTKKWMEIIRSGAWETHPTYGIVWDKELHLWPVPQTGGDVISFWYYGLPTRYFTLDVDPEISQDWDRCLEYGGTAYMLGGDTGWQQKYEAELARVSSRNLRNELSSELHVDSFIDEVGF